MQNTAGLRVAFFSPLPPARTGTADYGAALIAELSSLVRLTVFDKPPRRFNPQTFDAVVYQIANNPYHADIYRLALEHPGVAVLHEVNLHHLIQSMTAQGASRVDYLREVVYEVFGREPEEVLPDDAASIPAQPATFTIIRRLLDRSTACIVHSVYAERELRLKGFRRPLAVIPHGAVARHVDGSATRRKLGVPENVPLLGMFGYQRPDKQPDLCLRIFRDLLRMFPEARFLIAGQPHPGIRLHDMAAELGLNGRLLSVGFQSLTDFDACMAACDVILNVRHPTFGETSGTMMRAFGMGKTVVVSDNGGCSELPDDVCVKIPCDGYENRVLRETVRWLLEHPAENRAAGERARAWVAANCSWRRAANMYAAFLADLRRPPRPVTRGALDDDTIRRYLERWVDPATPSGQYFLSHARRFVRMVRTIPPGTGKERLLEMGCYLHLTPAFRNLLGYDVSGCYLGSTKGTQRARTVSRDGEVFECTVELFDAETDRFPYPDEHFATVVCGELIEHLIRDPVHMLGEVHRVLKPGGVLLLTTPNVVSFRSVHAALKALHPGFYNKYPRPKPGLPPDFGHSREYTPYEILHLLTDAGFVPSSIETGPYGDTVSEHEEFVRPLLTKWNLPVTLREDCIFALARKESVPKVRFPSWLYDW